MIHAEGEHFQRFVKQTQSENARKNRDLISASFEFDAAPQFSKIHLASKIIFIPELRQKKS